jgi:signal transduction histidine kinase
VNLTRPRAIAIAIAGLLAGCGVAAVQLASDHQDPRALWAVCAPLIGWNFVGTGLYAWSRRPESRIGGLMILLGFAWFVFTLQSSDLPLVYTFAAVAGGLWGGVFLHLGLSFPSGRLRDRYDRVLVAAGYVVFPLALVPALLFGTAADLDCSDCPENVLLVHRDPDLASLLQGLSAGLYLVLFVLVLVRACRRWLGTGTFERLQLTPVYVFSLLTFLLVTADRAGLGEGTLWAAFLSTGLMPFAYLGGLLRSHVVQLDAQLRDRLEELRASRARLVQAGDAERRRLERDLHDGAQSRLVAVSLLLRSARSRAAADAELSDLLERAHAEVDESLRELRELAHGIHPAVLTDHGLQPALEALVGRAPIPVIVEASCGDRLPQPVESAAYFVVSEALTNVAKYARATRALVAVRRTNAHVTVEVADDGVGGADATRGSGLRGLADRVAALDGTLSLESPPGRGTKLRAEIPVGPPG